MFLKDFWGALTVALTLIGYAPYLWGTYKGRLHPHLFSWIIWALVHSIAFFAQASRGAGPGAWFTGLTALICLAIVVLSSRGEKDITRLDIVALIGGLAAIPAWYLTNDAFWAVALAALIDFIGSVPTLRKAYDHPEHEGLFMWVVAGLRPLISLAAVEAYSATTVLFPLALSFNNLIVVAVVAWRRRANK